MKPKRKDNQAKSWRFFTVLTVMGLVCLAFFARAVQLHVVQSDKLKEEGDSRHIRLLKIPAERGEIHDRNGELLAASAPVHSIWCDPQEIAQYFIGRDEKLKEFEEQQEKFKEDITFYELMAAREPENRAKHLASKEKVEKTLEDFIESFDAGYKHTSLEPLAKALRMPISSLEQRIKENVNGHFVYLRRRIAPAIAKDVEAIDFPGVGSQLEYRRFYPSSDVFAPVLGYTDIDDKGKDGVERSFEKELSGETGSRRVIRDRTLNEIEDIGIVDEPRPGAVVNLSIDSRYQYVLHKELGKALKKYSADKAMGVLADPWTGEILAMVSLPSFNPNAMNSKDVSDWQNKAVRDVIEPGSTMKPLVMAAALEQGVLEFDEKIETPYQIFVNGGKVTNKYKGEFTLDEIMAKSMNVGMAKIIDRIPDNDLLDYLAKLGFGMESSIEYNVKPEGFLPVAPIDPFEKATMSYGYGMNASTVHLASAYSALATDGKIRPLTLVKDKKSENERYVFSEKVVERMKEMLVETVEKGTGKAARVKGYSVAGKTGTAFKINKRTGKYDSDLVQTAFAGFSPVENPQFVLVVVVDNPKGDHVSASSVAAPVFSNTLQQILPLAGIMPNVSKGDDNG